MAFHGIVFGIVGDFWTRVHDLQGCNIFHHIYIYICMYIHIYIYNPTRRPCKLRCLSIDPHKKEPSEPVSREAAMPCLRAQRDALKKVEAQEVGPTLHPLVSSNMVS